MSNSVAWGTVINAIGTSQVTGTNAQPNIDGLRESSVSGDMGYRVFTTPPYEIPLIP